MKTCMQLSNLQYCVTRIVCLSVSFVLNNQDCNNRTARKNYNTFIYTGAPFIEHLIFFRQGEIRVVVYKYRLVVRRVCIYIFLRYFCKEFAQRRDNVVLRLCQVCSLLFAIGQRTIVATQNSWLRFLYDGMSTFRTSSRHSLTECVWAKAVRLFRIPQSMSNNYVFQLDIRSV